MSAVNLQLQGANYYIKTAIQFRVNKTEWRWPGWRVVGGLVNNIQIYCVVRYDVNEQQDQHHHNRPRPLWMTTPIKLFTKQLTSHKIGDIKINFITLIMAITGCGVLWVIPQRIPDPCWSQWTRNWFSTSYKGHIITFRGSTGRTLECPCLGG